MGSAKDFGKHTLNTGTKPVKETVMGNGMSIEDDDDMPVQKNTAPAPVSADTRARLTALFEEYDSADEEVESAEQALEAATKARSDVVKQIAAAISPQKKLLRKGAEITIVQRGDTFFIRGGRNKKELIEL